MDSGLDVAPPLLGLLPELDDDLTHRQHGRSGRVVGFTKRRSSRLRSGLLAAAAPLTSSAGCARRRRRRGWRGWLLRHAADPCRSSDVARSPSHRGGRWPRMRPACPSPTSGTRLSPVRPLQYAGLHGSGLRRPVTLPAGQVVIALPQSSGQVWARCHPEAPGEGHHGRGRRPPVSALRVGRSRARRIAGPGA